MNCDIKVGVIIPVYNVEKYLKECLDSVLSQTYQNILVVLVDDASTDSSVSICKQYCKKDSRFMLLQNEVNQGLGQTRNNAIKYLLKENICEYVVFLDSDDYILPDCVRILLKSVVETGCNIGISKYTHQLSMLTSDDSYIKIAGVDFYKYRGRYKAFPSNCATSKIYKLSLFKKCFFPVGIHEDIAIIPILIMNENDIVLVDSTFYFYRINQASITNKKKNEKNIDRIRIFQKVVNYCIDKQNGCEQHFLSCMFSAINEQKIYLRNNKKLYSKAEFSSYMFDLRRIEKELKEKYDIFWKVSKSQKYYFSKYNGKFFSKIKLRLLCFFEKNDLW